MPTVNLSPQVVKDALCPKGMRKCDLFDSNCKGLMLEIRATGGKTYYLRYQDARGRTRQLRLALERDVSLQQARKLAEQKRKKYILNVLAEMLALIKTMQIENQPPLLHFMVYIIRKSGGGY